MMVLEVRKKSKGTNHLSEMAGKSNCGRQEREMDRRREGE